MYILEYNENLAQFHYNYINKDGKWHYELFSYGWKPVTILPNNTIHDPDFRILVDSLSYKNYPLEKVVYEILTFLSQK